jgi:hypothetical protein
VRPLQLNPNIDHIVPLLQEQLYIVFITADGGQDLEKFELRDFEEAQSILLQVNGRIREEPF